MKHAYYPTLIALLMLFAFAGLTAQTMEGDKITVPLSDPSQPAHLKVNLMNGAITVTGYSGKDVLIEGRPLDITAEEEEEEDHDPEDEAKAAKRRGMHRISNSGSGLSVEEDHNEVSVSTGWRSMGRPMGITVKVPVNSSMKLSTMNDGDITVTGVKGDLEISNMNGGITLKDISGSVVADALNDDIKVVFSSLDPKKNMSFSSMNGDIDVTLPASAKATLRLKNDMGEIYSDFEMKIENTTSKVEDREKSKRGRYKVTLEKTMTGIINGGGPEISFKNFNGDIYIRKGK